MQAIVNSSLAANAVEKGVWHVGVGIIGAGTGKYAFYVIEGGVWWAWILLN